MAKIPFYLHWKDQDYELIRDVNKKMRRINTHPEYSKTIRKKFLDDLIEDANAHSFTMELGGLDEKELTESNHHDLTDAWKFAEENYKGNFSHDFLINIAGKIEPTLKYKQTILVKGLNYRRDNIRVTGIDAVAPIGGHKVKEEMVSLVDFLNDDREESLVRAIFGHMHLARIHPFYDGNGRTARMIQNLILSYKGYPGIRIEFGERNLYQRLLRNSLRDFRNRESTEDYSNGENIKTFFTYLASIENINLDRLKGELKKRRSFEVNIFGAKDKAQFITVEHILKNSICARMSNKGIRAKLNRDKTKIIVKGNISKKEIEYMLKGACNSGFSCQVRPLTK